MRRLFSAILASATLFALAVPASAMDPMMSGMKKTCPKGSTMVKGYTKKDGTKVDGYCRKDKGMMKGDAMKGDAMKGGAMKGAMMSPAPAPTK